MEVTPRLNKSEITSLRVSPSQHQLEQKTRDVSFILG